MRAMTWIAAVAAGMTASGGAADWDAIALDGSPVASLSAVSAAAVTPSRVVLAGIREEAGTSRIYLRQCSAGAWMWANGGLPVEDGAAGPVRAPLLVTDGAGGVAVLYTRHDGASGWRVHGLLSDGAMVLPIDDGLPGDAPIPGATVNAIAGTWLSGGEMHVLYTQFDGARMALRGSWWAGGNWQPVNEWGALDLGGDGWTDAPSMARDDADGAVAAYTQETASGRRLFAIRLAGPWLGRTWERFDGGAPLDRPDLGNVNATAVATLAGGRALIAYLQEDGGGVPRLYAVIREGAGWTRVNGGEPLDAAEHGVADLALAAAADGGAMLAYVALDADGAPAGVRALAVRGASAVPMNGGAALEASGGVVAGVDLALAGGTGWLLFEQPAGLVYGRPLAAEAAAAPAAPAAAPVTDGLEARGTVFRPGAGERATLAWSAATAQPVRVTIHAITGEPVATLAEGTHAGRREFAWDGRDAAGRAVAPGVYVVRARGGTFNQSRKLVVVR
jgi:hypothetical protein